VERAMKNSLSKCRLHTLGLWSDATTPALVPPAGNEI